MKACMICATALALTWSPVHGQGAPRPYWDDNWRGWHFYEAPEEAEAPSQTAGHRPVQPAGPRAPVGPRRAPELTEFERMQTELEDSRKVAIVRPSEDNVRRYMELEAAVVRRASLFADVAQRVAWASPQLDPTLQGRPVNARALEVFEQQQLSERSRAVSDLGRDHVLVFFFRGDCPYCHAFAPTLAEFQARHGIKVEAVSMDGGSLPGFAGARRDNGVGVALQVRQVPAVFLAQPFTGTITPIGFGVLSETQLLERIVAVTDPAYSAMLPGATLQFGRPTSRQAHLATSSTTLSTGARP